MKLMQKRKVTAMLSSRRPDLQARVDLHHSPVEVESRATDRPEEHEDDDEEGVPGSQAAPVILDVLYYSSLARLAAIAEGFWIIVPFVAIRI